MAISGFPIIATTNGNRTANQEWFLQGYEGQFRQSAGGSLVDFEAFDESLDFSFVLNADPLIIVSNDVNKKYDEQTTAAGPGSEFFIDTNAGWLGNAQGILYLADTPVDILWDSDTPKDFLREIHVQFDVPSTSTAIIEFTFDGGTTWMPVNNGVAIKGVATMTFFLQYDAEFNIRGDAALSSMGCIVAAG